MHVSLIFSVIVVLKCCHCICTLVQVLGCMSVPLAFSVIVIFLSVGSCRVEGDE
jgi:hypothetical protein